MFHGVLIAYEEVVSRSVEKENIGNVYA